MTKLYSDCTTDAERAKYFRDGSAWEAGIIAQTIQKDVADAFQFRADNEGDDEFAENGQPDPLDPVPSILCKRGRRLIEGGSK